MAKIHIYTLSLIFGFLLAKANANIAVYQVEWRSGFYKSINDNKAQISSFLSATTGEGPPKASVNINSTASASNSTGYTFSVADPEKELPLVEDVIFHGLVSLGTPGQKLKMLFDTGSSDFWVRSSVCISAACEDKEMPEKPAVDYVATTAYNYSKSSTIRLNMTGPDVMDIQEISYGTGNVQVLSAWDTLTLNTTNGPVTVHNQSFGMTYKQSYFPFGAIDFDGIIGLGFKALALPGHNPPLYSMQEQGAIKKKMFGYWVNPDEDPGLKGIDYQSVSTGELHLGGYDEQRISGGIKWIPLRRALHWTVQLLSLDYEGVNYLTEFENVTMYGEPGVPATFDTGTTAIVLPKALAKKLVKSIGGFRMPFVGLLYAKCKNRKFGKPIKFRFNVYKNEAVVENDTAADPEITYHEFSVSSDDYVISEAYMSSFFGYCALAITGRDIIGGGQNMLILGQTFLKSVYSIWDLDNERIGLADLRLPFLV